MGRCAYKEFEELVDAPTLEVAENSLNILTLAKVYPDWYGVGDAIVNDIYLLERHIAAGMKPEDERRARRTIEALRRNRRRSPLDESFSKISDRQVN